MSAWSTEKIVAVGITIAFMSVILAADIVSVANGSMEITALAKEIAIGLFGYMGRGAAQGIDKKQTKQEPPSNLPVKDFIGEEREGK